MLSRREVLALGAVGVLSPLRGAEDDIPMHDVIPSVDYHVHVGEELTAARAIELAKR